MKVVSATNLVILLVLVGEIFSDLAIFIVYHDENLSVLMKILWWFFFKNIQRISILTIVVPKIRNQIIKFRLTIGFDHFCLWYTLLTASGHRSHMIISTFLFNTLRTCIKNFVTSVLVWSEFCRRKEFTHISYLLNPVLKAWRTSEKLDIIKED